MPFVKRGTLTSVGKKYAFATCAQSIDRESVYVPATADLLNNGSFAHFQPGQNVVMLCDNQNVQTNERSQTCPYIALSIVLHEEVKVINGEVAISHSGAVYIAVSGRELCGQNRKLNIFLPPSVIRYFLNGRKCRAFEYKENLELGDRVTIGVIPQPEYKGSYWSAVELIELPKLYRNHGDHREEIEFQSSYEASTCESKSSSPSDSCASVASMSNDETTINSIPVYDSNCSTPYVTENQEDYPSLASSGSTSNAPIAATVPQIRAVNVSDPQYALQNSTSLMSVQPPSPCLTASNPMYYSNQHCAPYCEQPMPYVLPVSMVPSTLMEKVTSPALPIPSSNGNEPSEIRESSANDEADYREKKPFAPIEKRMLKWLTSDIDCLKSIMSKNPELFTE
uniref:Uncharacterized protein n=1 Tax=Plectus sambesii TaxID=2011161 RepID=A0A914XLQ6_9BILA